MAKQVYRYLRGYTLDPGFSTQLETMCLNDTVYRVRWEDLKDSPGPNGEYFEIIDIDHPSNSYYDPVDLETTEILSQNGLKPSEGNPQFHQQFVYAIAMKTLVLFEQSLGRKLIWAPRPLHENGKELSDAERYVGQIRLYPHAFRGANAYYHRDKKSILFGYFKAALQVRGANFPGGAVFSCLSPDIIAHEVTHSLLDSIHPRYLEDTNRDVAAFHEGFADIIALLQRFMISDLVINQLYNAQGSFDHFTVLGELATQLGTAIARGRGALRSAIGQHNAEGKWERQQPDPGLYQSRTECHTRGSILVATFFDALIKVYTYRTADLFRIATNGTGVLPKGAIHPDLAKRLSEEVCNIAEHLLNIAIRALDYCPPVDINFGDYLRALITADIEFAKEDERIYRIALIDAFRSWGIFPSQVTTLSEDSLQWSAPDLSSRQISAMDAVASFLRERVRGLNSITDRKQVWLKSQEIQRDLHRLMVSDSGEALGDDWEDLLDKLGLLTKSINFHGESGLNVLNENINRNTPIEIHKVRPAFRVGRQGLVLEQVIVTITRSINVDVNQGNGKSQSVRFRGGSTIIFDGSKDFSLSYVITKRINNNARFHAQLKYQLNSQGSQDTSFTDSMYGDNTGFKDINFGHLHFH